jgi:stress response protein SCP2
VAEGRRVALLVAAAVPSVPMSFNPNGDGLKVEVLNDAVIEIIEASNLITADSAGMFSSASSDPYVVVKDVKGLRGSDRRTQVSMKNLNPKWRNQTFRYQFNYKLSAFKFVVKDSDKGDWLNMDGDDPLGKCELPVGRFYGQVPIGQPFTIDAWLPLKSPSSRRGECERRGSKLHVRCIVTFKVPVVLPGMRVPLPLHFQVAVGWDFKKKERPFDLDASIVGLDHEESVVDTVSYRRLNGFGGAVRHSGDDTTGAGDGDDETITIDIHKLPKRVEKLALVINSYGGQSLSNTKFAYVRVIANGCTQCFYGLGKGKVVPCTGLFVGTVQLARDRSGYEFLTCGWVIAQANTNQNQRVHVYKCCILLAGGINDTDCGLRVKSHRAVANGKTISDSLPAVLAVSERFSCPSL